MRTGGVGSGHSSCHSGWVRNSDGVWLLCLKLGPRQVPYQTPTWDDYQSTTLCYCTKWWQGSKIISPGCPNIFPSSDAQGL